MKAAFSDDAGRTFTFLITEGLPGFVVEAGNTFTVRELAGGLLVLAHTHL